MFARFRFLVVAVALSSCATTGHRTAATRSPSVLNDSVLAAVGALLPAPADSSAPHLDVPRGALHHFFSGSTAKKDKRQFHVTIYNAPATVKGGSTAVVGDGNVTADNRKAAAPVATGDSAAAIDNTKAGQKGGAAATASGATATAITEDTGTPWWTWVLVFLAGVLVGGVLGLIWICRQLRP